MTEEIVSYGVLSLDVYKRQPVTMGQGVTFREANLTFLCKKLYQHQFSRDDLAPEIQAYYAAAPQVYPDFQGGWQPHIVFVGEIMDVRDDR